MQHFSITISEPSLNRLESLPGELLDIIFDETWSEEPQVTHPVSPALKPYFQRNLYRSIKLDYTHFLLLCADSLHLASLVKNLKMTGSRSAPQDYEIGNEDTIYIFFKSATSLRFLDTSSAVPRLPYRILSPKFAIGCFPSLESLAVSISSLPHFSSPTRHLSLFDKLLHVAVEITDAPTDIEPGELEYFDKQDQSVLDSIGNKAREHDIDSISLRGVPQLAFGILVKRSRSLRKLEVFVHCDRYPQRQLSNLLSAIPNPSNLTSLLFNAVRSGGLFVSDGTEVSFARFVNLERLKIFQHVVTPALVASLFHLRKIKSVELCGPGPPSYANIITLLHPANRSPTLRSLLFPAPVLITSRDNSPFDLEAYLTKAARLGPMRLKWEDPGMSLQNAREVVRVAEMERVELSRDFVKAVELTHSYEVDKDRWNSRRDGVSR